MESPTYELSPDDLLRLNEIKDIVNERLGTRRQLPGEDCVQDGTDSYYIIKWLGSGVNATYALALPADDDSPEHRMTFSENGDLQEAYIGKFPIAKNSICGFINFMLSSLD